MVKSVLLLSVALACGPVGLASAQDTTAPVPADTPDAAPEQDPAASQDPAVADQSAADATGQGPEQGEIIVTATRRNQALSDVPIAVSAVSAEALANSGAVDIRQLNQLSPSLLVSSTSSEAGGGVARIRGIGTVGDNPGLESSVGTFIDGVYRSRSGVALTELGAVERIEVLRGPQGTLFGRNTSAGLINIVTQRPSFESEGNASFTYGNYDHIRAEAGITGPIFGGDTVALRVDGVYLERKGFLEDAISGRRINDRDRYLVRGQLLVRPSEDLDIRIIGDYSDRSEECCGAVYAPLVDRVRSNATPAGTIGDVSLSPSIFAPVIRGQTDPAGNPAVLNDDIGRRQTAITPGRDYRSDVTDWGISGEINWALGDVNVTSITAYRDYQLERGQDADFNNLDLFYRDGFEQSFETFSQELRLQGQLFDERLDWLVGGYYAHEVLDVRDNLKFGTQFDAYTSRFLAFANPALARLPQFGFANLPGFVDDLLARQGVPAPVRGIVTARVPSIDLNDVGVADDRYEQTSRNYAFFTHNQIRITDRIGVTLGVRYTNEEKELDTELASNNTGCAAIRQAVGNVAALAGTPPFTNPALAALPPTVAGLITGLTPFPCLVGLNTTLDGSYDGKKKEDKFTGTAVVSLKPIDDLLIYGSYSRGYKAGGFNLDRSALSTTAPNVSNLIFAPETVDAYEIGAKFDGRRIDLNVALFRQEFENFQLNQFNGLAFVVENINGCSEALSAPAAGQLLGACDPSKTEAGVTSTGVELEAFVYPVRDLSLSVGVTYSETEYRRSLVGANGRALLNDFFLLPGATVSNAPRYVVTSAATWTPSIGSGGYSALLYADTRLQSEINTGSDLDIEKVQDDFVLVNARIGIRGPEQAFSVELWGQNIFNENYTQVAFDAPLQPIGGSAGGRVTELPAATPFAVNRSTALFGRFLGEPRTYGVTVRTRF